MAGPRGPLGTRSWGPFAAVMGTTEPLGPLGTGPWGHFGDVEAKRTLWDRATGTLWGQQSHKDPLEQGHGENLGTTEPQGPLGQGHGDILGTREP